MNRLDLTKKFFVHELTEFSSLAEYYQVLNDKKVEIASAAEDACFGTKIAKMFLDKSLLPASININNSTNELVIRIEQGFSFPQNNFSIKDHEGKCICVINQKMSLFSSYFELSDANMHVFASIKGNLRNKEFQICRIDGSLIAQISHKNSTLARDLLTTADDYEINLGECNYEESLIALAATICMDFAFHES